MAASTSLSFFSSSIFSPSSHRPSKPPHFSLHTAKPIATTTTLSIKSELAQPLPLPLLTTTTTLPVLNFSGDQVSTTLLSLRSAPPDTARSVVHHALVTLLNNRRRGTASTLTRAEVRGGGIKPYPQKKTGRARRGSQRSPLRPGGGVIFGPKPKDWSVKMNKKEKRLALSTAIASAAAAGSSVVVEEFGDKFTTPKTKDFIAAMDRWGFDPRIKSLFFMMQVEENVEKSGRNIGTLKMLTPRSLNLYDVLESERLVFTPAAVDYLNKMYGAGFDVNEDDEEEDGEVDGGEDVASEQQSRETRR